MGGLGNRLRAILAAEELAKKCGLELDVVWIANAELHCAYGKLFKTDCRAFRIKEKGKCAWIKYGLPMKKNLYLPLVYQDLRYGVKLYQSRNIEAYLDDSEKLEKLVESGTGDVLICSESRFYPCDDNLFGRIFCPTEAVRNLVNEKIDRFGRYTVGVHIRRTDNRVSIEESPIEEFEKRMDVEIEMHSDATFYVATDSEEVKEELRTRYGARIITSPNRATRTSEGGVIEALAEIFALARSQRFYGSYYSSFSDTVGYLRGGDIELVRKNSWKNMK